MTISKYKAIKTKVGREVFDSKKEANRYKQLLILQQAGKISDLQRQRRILLQDSFTNANGEHVRPIYYIADFVYIDNETQKTIVEDVKGMRTDVYKLKKKLFEKKYNIAIKEV